VRPRRGASGARRRAPLATTATVLAVALASAAPAAADFVPVPKPYDELRQLAVADGSHWAAVARASERVSVTADAGATWTPVALEGDSPLVRGVGAAADGTFRLLVVSWTPSGEPVSTVHRVTADGDSTEVAAIPEFVGFDMAVDDDGSTWSLTSSTLRVVRDDGSVTTADVPGDCQPCPRLVRTAFGMRVETGSSALQLEGATLVPAEARPVMLVDGPFQLAESDVSWDGGAHWAWHGHDFRARAVPRAPGLGGGRLLQTFDGRIATRWSSWLFRATALAVPYTAGLTHRVVDAGDRIVAWDEQHVWLHAGPLPPFPQSVGQLEADTRAMVDRVNVFRADAGLPPIVGDAMISRASRNHSQYTVLNDVSRAGLSAHEETPGNPGFTGIEPWDRCAAVGTTCHSEVMFSQYAEDPVGGWLATPFHRFVPGSPTAGTVGAGRVPDGWSTMNGGEPAGILVDAYGYPNGRWRGEAGFGGEVPDPVETCAASDQSIAYPVGIAVSLYAPSTGPDGFPAVSRIAVRRRSGGMPLPGCLIRGLDNSAQFVLDDPLTHGETYDVEGDWAAGDVLRTLRWSFTYAPEPSAAPREPRTPRRRSARKRARCMGRAASLSAGPAGGAIRGTRRADTIVGSRATDRIRAGGGGDRVCASGGGDRVRGGAGTDAIEGGEGRDAIRGGAGDDRIDAGRDRDAVAAGLGSDRLALVDRARDLADCGPGRHDRVRADRVDVLRRCEHVVRVG
jgi:RTX calcium-binding nonapeptide repeat (4 copies)